MKNFLNKLFFIFLLSISYSNLNAQNLSDFNSPVKFIKYTNSEGAFNIETKVQYNGESFLLFINGKLEVILTDLLFIRDQITEGVNCKAYHATCTKDKTRYLVLFAEKTQFFLIKMEGNEFLALSNK
jgi:hypothetical protein